MIEPTTEQEIAQAVRDAAGPLSIRGGGTRGMAPASGEVFSLARVSGISLYEPGALTIVAGAGTPMSEIDAALQSEGQMLPFEPMDHRVLLGTSGEPTIGGVVGANVSGPRRLRAGGCRDSLIGVRFVDGRGEVLKNGGRVMKNVTGYDLVKLMSGSYGTLGVLSEVSFKLLPKPDATGVLTLTGLPLADGIAAMSAALGSPYEVTGAAMTPAKGDAESIVRLRLEGFESSVSYRGEQLKKTLAQFGTADFALGGEDDWRAVRDVEAFASKTCVWRLAIKASDVPAMLEDGIWPKFPCDALLDWGGGLVWIGCDDAELGKIAQDPVAAGALLHTHLQDHMKTIGGHATLLKAPDALKVRVPVFQPEAAPLAALANGLRTQFDPRGILNPGVMG
ncbi:FAD-binding protein [Boseongicola aestuarii]|uniref:Putative FAD-linked oxidoreductase n=1 Tax=Boseongicola aestuarii TaxID=1470561 RepID=A0A238J4E3_9RHOB|nr:FAD-binding protein [Boseongicola aestuarii]SMX24774.1 putative FAD-linked oxidoreductase [Boseongicola aestuarii]